MKHLVLSICFVLAFPVYSNEATIYPEENTRKRISLSQRDNDKIIIVDDDVEFLYKHYEHNKAYSFLIWTARITPSDYPRKKVYSTFIGLFERFIEKFNPTITTENLAFSILVSGSNKAYENVLVSLDKDSINSINNRDFGEMDIDNPKNKIPLKEIFRKLKIAPTDGNYNSSEYKSKSKFFSEVVRDYPPRKWITEALVEGNYYSDDDTQKAYRVLRTDPRFGENNSVDGKFYILDCSSGTEEYVTHDFDMNFFQFRLRTFSSLDEAASFACKQ